MKKTHRTAHRLIWILLLPALLSFVYFAEQDKAEKAPTIEQAPYPSLLGELP